MKTDIHIHCAIDRYPTKGGNPRLPESHYQADDKEILNHMDALGIQKAVLMSSGERMPAGNLNNSNDVCRELVRRYPDRFFWMCMVDPVHPETVKERLSGFKAQGAVGVGEIMINEWLDSPFLQALFAAAQELELPVLFHMSTRPGVSYGVCDRKRLPLVEWLLQTYPDLKVIGHSQVFWMEISGDCPDDDEGRSGFGKGPVIPGGRVVQLLQRYPNLYADLSAFSGNCAILRDPDFGVNFCEEFQDRLMFGTDMTNGYVKHPLSQFLDEKMAQGELSRTAWENIFYKNAHRLLGV